MSKCCFTVLSLTNALLQLELSKVLVPSPGGRGRGYFHILAIRECAAGKGMVFKPLSLV